jgi:tetratricopeptide (TPR) repeat protein
VSKVGRNDPCPCGSGKKFKKCCLEKHESESRLTKKPDAGSMAGHVTGPVVTSGVGLEIEKTIEAGYMLMSSGQSVEACRKWDLAWQTIKEEITDDSRDVHTLEDKLQLVYGTLFNYCQEYGMELGNAGIEDPSFHQQRVEYCSEFLRLLPDSDPDILENMGRSLAEGYCGVGKPDEAARVFEQLVTDFPQSAWAHIGWGDMYWQFRVNKDNPIDLEKAEQIYNNALTVIADKRDKQDILDRLKDVKKEKVQFRGKLSWE